MAVIMPTITTDDPHVFRDQMDIIASYAEGVHLDFADGVFAPTKLLPLSQAWRTEQLITHVHCMLQKPLEFINDLLKLDADLVIIHAEVDNARECLQKLRENGTRTGLALLPESDVSVIEGNKLGDLFDHVLIFGGHLGFQGGSADLKLLAKVEALKERYPDCELAWDGGVDEQNAKEIVSAGIDILNVGSYLHSADDPKKAYDLLMSLIQS